MIGGVNGFNANANFDFNGTYRQILKKRMRIRLQI